MNSLDWKKVLISGVVFAVLAVMLFVGVYLVRKPQSQSVTSKAASTTGSGWPINPNPTDGQTGVSLSPVFSWGYETEAYPNCNPAGSYANVYVWNCAAHNDSCLIGFGGQSSDTASIYSVPSTGVHPYISLGVPDYNRSIAPLSPDKQYWWYVTPKACGVLHFEENKAWTFTTGAGSQTVACNQTCDATHLCSSGMTCDTVSGTCRNSACSTQTSCVCPVTVIPDCTSLTTTADLNNLQIGQLYTFSMTVSGPATSIVMPVYFDNSCTTLTNNTAPYRASGPGTYTTSWRPTRAGPFVAYGQVNAGTTSCQADCGGTQCAGAASCKLTGTVKTQIVACNQTCDATHLCPSSLSCTGGKCVNPSCPTTQDSSCNCPQTVSCNQTCNGTTLLCPSTLTCTGGKCVNPSCPTTQDASCVCPTPAGACQRVTASKDLSTIKIGDTVTFTGFGTLSNPVASDSIDKINFIISKDGAEASNTEAVTTLDSAGVWKATKDFSITSPGSYSVRIRAHWLSKNSWLE